MMSSTRSVRLLAVVRASELCVARLDAIGAVAVSEDDLAAVAGMDWTGADGVELAVRHDEAVQAVQTMCTSVVPFRLGTMFRDEGALRAMLRAHRSRLLRMLERFVDRVEMGLKLRLARDPTSTPPRELEAVRSLAPYHGDRRERLTPREGGAVFEGSYLIPRTSVGDFWEAFEDIQTATPKVAALGSGPWAPYSFCDDNGRAQSSVTAWRIGP